MKQFGVLALLSLTACTNTLGRWPGFERAGVTVYQQEEISMEKDVAILKGMYERFNARDIDGVLATLADDVAWANGMDGGHVHGLEAVREYWTRQWAVVSPRVEPMSFGKSPDGSIVVHVQQSVRDLEGRPLQDQTHGLHDKVVGHVFQFQRGKVVRFDIQDASWRTVQAQAMQDVSVP